MYTCYLLKEYKYTHNKKGMVTNNFPLPDPQGNWRMGVGNGGKEESRRGKGICKIKILPGEIGF